MMEKKVTFSFVIPTYNTSIAYFTKCIDSIYNQITEDDQIIIVDDGSTEQLIFQYESVLPRKSNIVFIKQMNAGVSAARNKGLKYAKGEYLFFVDSDDWLEKDTITELRNEITKTWGDIYYFNSSIEFINATIKKPVDLPEKLSINKLIENCFKKDESYGVLTGIDAPWGKVFKRSLIIEEKISFPLNFKRCEDTIFCLQALKIANSARFINTLVYHYRMRNSSVCRKFDNHIIENEINVIKYLNEYIVDNNLDFTLLYSIIRQIVCGDFMNIYFMHQDNPDSTLTMSHKAKKVFEEYDLIRDAFLNAEVQGVKESLLALFLRLDKISLYFIALRFLYQLNRIRKKIQRNKMICFD